MKANPATRRLPELDGLRGIAIAMVLLLHYVSLQIPDGSPLNWLKVATSRMHYGVDLFFVLSGFLIASILLENREAPHYFRAFYARRFCRILPLYLVVVVAYHLALGTAWAQQPHYGWLMAPKLPGWTYATFTQNFWMAAHHLKGAEWLSVTWSLAVEEQFYLTLPLLVRFLPARFVGGGAALTIVGLLGYRIVTKHSPQSYLPFFNADCMAMGVLLAVLFRHGNFVGALQRRHVPLALAAGLLTLAFAAVTWRPDGLGGFEKTLLVAWFGLLLALPIASPACVWAAVLRQRWLVWLGQRSYGVYLIHQILSSILHGEIFARVPTLDSAASVLVTIGALVLTLLIAEASYRFFENPINRRAHRVRYRDPNAAPVN
jgi:peptidoglycan/LPS O-acetylase OafA/YrhL